MSVVGIDLGTTNTVVACVKNGRVHVLADPEGRRLLPSVVSFHPNGEILVGSPAKQRRTIDARNTIASVKRLLGRPWNSPELEQARHRSAFELKEGPGQGPIVVARGRELTLAEISAFILKRAREIAETALGEPVERAVITVPAHFNELQRAATKVAGRVAGLEVLRILNEPTAAALAYGLGKGSKERVAVYDFGGGTFDATLLDLNGNVFEVLATAGDPFLGGDDVDDVIADRMAEAFLLQHRFDPRTDPQGLERLRQAAEQLKITLSGQDQAQVHLREIAFGVGGAHLDLTFGLTRGELEKMMEPLVERTFRVTQDALTLARLAPSEFDRTILVGGTSRIPLVRRRVEAFFGSPPMDRMNPEEVVAIGAAIQAAALSDASRRRSIPAPPPGMGGIGLGATRTSTPSFAEFNEAAPPSSSVSAPPPPIPDVDDESDTQAMDRKEIPAAALRSSPALRSSSDLAPSTQRGAATAPMPVPTIPTSTARMPAPPPAPPPPLARTAPMAQPPARTPPPPPHVPASRPPLVPARPFGSIEEPSIASFTSPPLAAPTPAPLYVPSPPPPPLQRPPTPASFEARAAQPPQGATQRISSAPPPPVRYLSQPPVPPVFTQSQPPPVLIDVTPRALVVETAGGYCDVVIPRNAKIPCERTRIFSTAQDGQQHVRVRVAQGEEKAFRANTFLGELELTGIRAAPRGEVTIAVTFELDADGSLRVRASDTATGTQATAQLHLAGIAGDQEIVTMQRRLHGTGSAGPMAAG